MPSVTNDPEVLVTRWVWLHNSRVGPVHSAAVKSDFYRAILLHGRYCQTTMSVCPSVQCDVDESSSLKLGYLEFYYTIN